jgi:arginine exporter protein ArgO
MENKIWTIFGVAFILFIGYSVFKKESKDLELNANKVISEGIIDSFSECGIHVCYDYHYIVNGVVFFGTCKSSIVIPECRYGGHCIGRKFVLHYSKYDFENSRIYLNQEIISPHKPL